MAKIIHASQKAQTQHFSINVPLAVCGFKFIVSIAAFADSNSS
ncbi:hypothetical protein [Helicobacter marmotae]|nr:hypothetical protein [Helicobacter marmotae]